MSVLHFKNAVLEHHAWWERFEQFLNGQLDHMPKDHVQHDHLCTIGQWLHGDGAENFAHHPEFDRVKTLHQKLHGLAAQCWQAKVDEAHDQLETLLDEIKRIRHDMFMAWNDLNAIIGVYE